MRQLIRRRRLSGVRLAAVAVVLAALTACSTVQPPKPAPSAPASARPSPNAKDCIRVPSVCGYPDETNTGVPPKTPLTRVPGEATTGDGWTWREDVRAVVVSGSGVEISGLDIEDAMIIVYDKDVTIRNVRLTTGQLIPINCAWGGSTRAADSCLGLLIEDSEIVGLDIGCQVGIGFSGYTARRVHVSKCQDGFKANSDVLIEDSYVDDLWFESDGNGNSTHNDAVQTTGGSGVTLRHNTFSLGDLPDANAIVQFGTEDHPTISGWLIENNLLDGGGYAFNARPPVTDAVIRGNRFTRRNGFGIGTVKGATWADNVWDDTGTPIPLDR